MSQPVLSPRAPSARNKHTPGPNLSRDTQRVLPSNRGDQIQISFNYYMRSRCSYWQPLFLRLKQTFALVAESPAKSNKIYTLRETDIDALIYVIVF